VANPEYFPPGSNVLLVRQSVTVPANGSVALAPEWKYKGATDEAGAGPLARPLYAVQESITGGTLADLRIRVDVEGASLTPDEGVAASLVILTAPPQIAIVDLLGANVPGYGKPWAPVISSTAASPITLTLTWRFQRGE
jgi:hypothetical protein